MRKKLPSLLTIPIVIIHLIVLFLWITHWELLVTTIGLICWIGSILFGILLYLWHRKLQTNLFSKRLILISTSITILLAFFALLIEVATSSML